MANIHATAVVDPSAKLGTKVEIGPFCVVGPHVELGDGVVVHSHAVIIGRTVPGGLRYATFTLEDGVSFVHVASVDTPDGRNPLGRVAAFARFQEGVAGRCDDPPVATELREVGSYRFFGDG